MKSEVAWHSSKNGFTCCKFWEICTSNLSATATWRYEAASQRKPGTSLLKNIPKFQQREAVTVTQTLSAEPVNLWQSITHCGKLPASLKGAVSRYSVIFCAFLRKQKWRLLVPVSRTSDLIMKAWPSARPGSLATYAGCWHDSAVYQRQVEPELHCFTCRRWQAALLFSGYEARARWYPLLQGSRLAVTAISISILYSGVWFCAPSEACFGDLVAESMVDCEKETAVWS